MRRALWIAPALALLTLVVPRPVLAGNTATVPKGVFILDESRIEADTQVAWDANRKPLTLLQGLDRYEPGGGLQGTIIAKPFVRYRFIASQLLYGLTDRLTLAVGVPLVTSTTITPNLGWTTGDYQSSLGRKYTEDDFWQWAKSMGQPKPGSFDGNHYTLADIVLGGRWRLPDFEFLQAAGLQMAVSAQVAIPTGKTQDPEDLVAAGTTVWDLHNYGDIEVHLAFDRPFKFDGVTRLNFAIDGYYGWLRPREFVTPQGTRNPLLMTFAPFVGPTYTLDPGDFLGVIGMIEFVPIVGPTWASLVSGGSLEKAQSLPPLLSLLVGHNYVHVGQTKFTSLSPIWTWDREKVWRPGDKNTVRLGADVSLLRMGLPLQFYWLYRNQEWIPGRNTRASNVATVGLRLVLKFW